MGLRDAGNRTAACTDVRQIRQAPAFCPSSLSTGPPAFKRGDVPGPISSALNRLVATLCVALTIVYAATMPVKANNQIQHLMPVTVAHQHSMLGVVPVDADHKGAAVHADHDKHGSEEQNRSGADGNSGHHHHGDSGSTILLPDAAATPQLAPSAGITGLGKERAIAGLRSIEPDRPPRTTSLNA